MFMKSALLVDQDHYPLMEGHSIEPCEEAKTDEVGSLMETESWQEARLVENLAEENTEKYHVEGVSEGRFHQVTLLPMT